MLGVYEKSSENSLIVETSLERGPAEYLASLLDNTNTKETSCSFHRKKRDRTAFGLSKPLNLLAPSRWPFASNA